MHDLPEHLFHYCERAGDPSLWAEPLNLVTNAVFLIYGYLAIRWLRGLPSHSWREEGDIWALSISMFLIGLGSGLWHSWALPGWTVLVDTIPIYIFINIYVVSLFRRLGGWEWWQIAALWLVFTGISTIVRQTVPADALNGSIMYMPTFALMLLAGLYLMAARKPSGKAMVGLSGLFLLSLTFRSIDTAICGVFPLGTHFIWHCLNAMLLYGLVRVLLPREHAAA